MPTVVETSSGRLEGTRRGRHVAFLGVPFAKPPVGPRRFLPPEPVEPWAGVRQAQAFGPSCPQGAAFAPGVAADGPTSEDCLYLNVYTPEPDGRRRPVMFWIHGGAFILGSASSPLYDGGHLAERGDVVVITANYRLGALGLLHLGDDGARWGARDNLALLDQMAALRWVRDNVAAFGGDPDEVTIFGESAGGASVAYLLVAPDAQPLFRRAIAQSSAATLSLPSSAAAERTTRALFGELGLGSDHTEALRELPAGELVRAQRRVQAAGAGWRGFFPIADPKTLPTHPIDAMARTSKPLLIGANRDEWNLFVASEVSRWDAPMADEEVVARLAPALGGAEPAALLGLVATYRASRERAGLPSGGHALLRAIQGDYVFRFASTWWAEEHAAGGAETYSYLFSHESPGLRGALRACHALELPFVFGTLAAPGQDRFAGTGPDVEALSHRMMEHWVTFARSGDPSTPPARWPRFDAARRRTMVFERDSAVAEAPFDEEREALAAVARPGRARLLAGR